MSIHRLLALCATLALVSCSGGGNDTETSAPRAEGAADPVAAVEELVGAISEGDFGSTQPYAAPDQAALASLVEGASFVDVGAAIREGDDEIAGNFWSGFAQGAGSFLSGALDVSEGDAEVVDGEEFVAVRVVTADQAERTVWVRNIDGYRVDLFASFGAGLADKMIGPVGRLLGAQTPDSQLILARLQNVVPSLLLAAEAPDITAETRQQVLALVELITRVA